MAQTGLLKKIKEHIIENGPLTPNFIAENFLKMNGPVAAIMVNQLLEKSSLFFRENELWNAIKSSNNLISELQTVVCWPTIANDNRTILSISIWTIKGDDILHTVTVKQSIDVTKDFEEPNGLLSPNFSEAINLVYNEISDGKVLFFSHFHRRVVQALFSRYGFSISDEAFPLSTLFRTAKIKMITLNSGLPAIANTVINLDNEPNNSYSNCELLATLAKALYSKIEEQGVTSIEELDKIDLNDNCKATWAKANFSLDDIVNMTEKSGVYGYKDANGKIIYVGKAKNLKKRLLTYFRVSDESPEKLNRLREEAVDILHFICGTELEALILENRLINKHKPILNSQINLFERDSLYKKPPFGIYFLNQKSESDITILVYSDKPDIKLTTINTESINDNLSTDYLDKTFYNTDNGEKPSGVEKLIVERWLPSRLESLSYLESSYFNNGKEMIEKIVETVALGINEGEIIR